MLFTKLTYVASIFAKSHFLRPRVSFVHVKRCAIHFKHGRLGSQSIRIYDFFFSDSGLSPLRFCGLAQGQHRLRVQPDGEECDDTGGLATQFDII